MRRWGFWIMAMGLWLVLGPLPGQAAPVSESTQTCIECHESLHPGIVADWRNSRHAAVTPSEALSVEGLGVKVTGKAIPDPLRETAVGCAECHTMRAEAHADTFEHNGFDIHLAVSPGDCRTCHSIEADQFTRNIMSHAYANLAENALYNDLEHAILGRVEPADGRIDIHPAAPQTRAEACYHCHGTKLSVVGTETRETDMAGELEFPRIDGWPNQGVGRVNLDGTLGSCAACHTRHAFSIETARSPYTCKECHVGPDVPVFKVYEASKHGNLFSAHAKSWDMKAVPWTVGKDFTAPTCAACHVSLLVNGDGEVVSERSHQMNDRLPWRLFGLVNAHPHPLEPRTTAIRNKDGLPLPTALDGTPASAFLINEKEMDRRRQSLQAVCLSCHGTSWVQGHWARLEHTIRETNDKTVAATKLLQAIWEKGLATGPGNGGSPFDEAAERLWSDIWLIYANTVRFASAMGHGGDYGVFANGRYELNKATTTLSERLLLQPPPFESAERRK